MELQSGEPSAPRCAGVLLPVGSLPSRSGIGSLGAAAFEFLDFLKAAGQACWQVLPLGPTGYGDSPYQPFSVFAGNPYFVDPETLVRGGLISQRGLSAFDFGDDPGRIDYAKLWESRYALLHSAFAAFQSGGETEEFARFCRDNAFWLRDYSLFMALKGFFGNREWRLWPRSIRRREPGAVAEYSEKLKTETDFWNFVQFQFFRQWREIRRRAGELGIRIIGDMPIYAALDSADVWADRELFQMDGDGNPSAVAGVPPDFFSETGQLWGNPLYDWDAMEQTGFGWWKKRVAFAARLFDAVRIDHFIGFARYFSVPAEAETAASGTYRDGPGEKIIRAVDSARGDCRIIAEDLGVSLPQVRELLKKSGYPGMRVLEFAFDGPPENEHLPHLYGHNVVAYSGTHDNDTLAGYFGPKRREETRRAMKYLGAASPADIPRAAVCRLYESAADTVIVQAQDLLGLGSAARMNFPSRADGNWCWRLLPGQLTPDLAESLAGLARRCGRLPKMS